MSRTTYLHSGWTFGQTDVVERRIGNAVAPWLPAAVPGHVHLDLFTNGVIAHPFDEMNEVGCQWVDEKDWSYRTEFEWQPDTDLPRQVLRFEGLDTIATVTLNGDKVAECDNMFVPLDLDVTGKLLTGKNTLRVDFLSAVRIGIERRAPYMEKEGMGDVPTRLTERAFVRKAQYMYGWDWGPRLVSCGIWKPVSIVEFAGRITDVQVHQSRLDDSRTRIQVDTTSEGEGEALSFLTGHGKFVPLAKGENFVEGLLSWNPRGLGDPNTYTVVTVLVPPSTPAPASLQELEAFSPLDRKDTTTGIVRSKLIREKDAAGESFQFEINGKRIWARGANWIPDHSFPSVISEHQYREQLLRAVDMGFNMVRVWGGGLYEADAFYDICDELGLLVWQDFPFACGYYPDDEAWQAVVKHEAEVNVRRIRNHPSLANWCGNNENHQCWVEKWGGPANSPHRYYGLPLYAETIPDVLARLDPLRPYIQSSAVGASDTPLETPNGGGSGDQHYWDVWHGRGDWRFYVDSKARFSSEFGFCSSCSLSVWAKTIDMKDWSPHSEAVKWHDKTGKGHETFHGMIELHYPASESLEDWVYYSQLNQRDALRFGIEHFRRGELCKGSLIWQINDCWPVQSWAFVDSDGNYKALAYECRRLYADHMLSLERSGEVIRAWAANEGLDSWKGNLTVTACNTVTGAKLRVWTGQFDVATEKSACAVECALSGLNVAETIIVVESMEAGSTWQLLGEPKETRFVEPGDVVISTHAAGKLKVKTSGPVVDLFLTSNGSTLGLQDNILTALTPGVYELRCEGTFDDFEARSLSGDHRVIVTRSPI